MKEDIKYQKFKKILKYAILFVLGCIMIYSCSIADVNAATIGSNSIYGCDVNNNVVNSQYNYILDGDFKTGYLGSTYQGVMNAFSINFNASIQQGNTYTLELYANTGDWRNIGESTIQLFGSLGSKVCSENVNAYTITSVSATYYKIIITFIANSTASYSKLSLANLSGLPLTGITNWKIDSLSLTDHGNQSTNDIIINQNQQTQTIIDSNTQNKNEIIDNQNKNNEELKEEIKENFNSCYFSRNLFNINSTPINSNVTTTVSDNKILLVTNTNVGNTGLASSKFPLSLKKNTTYTLTFDYSRDNISNSTMVGIRQKSNGGDWLSSTPGMGGSNGKKILTFNSGDNTTAYLWFYIKNSSSESAVLTHWTFDNIMLVEGSSSLPYEPYGEEICSNKIDETNDKLDNLTGAITDSSSPDTSGLSDAAGWLPPGPVDSLLTLPINLLNSLLGNLESTCNPINLTLPFVNKSFTIPCPVEILNNFGDNFMTFFIWFGAIAGCWCLYKYFINLYKWVEIHLSMDEKESLGKWGGV